MRIAILEKGRVGLAVQRVFLGCVEMVGRRKGLVLLIYCAATLMLCRGEDNYSFVLKYLISSLPHADR